MKYAKCALLVLLLSVICIPTSTHAVQATISTESHWSIDTPLLLSAYQRTFDGNSVAVAEVFNTSHQLVNVTQWRLAATYEAVANGNTKNETVYAQVRLRDGVSGELAPGKHAVVEISGGTSVPNSSYIADGFERPQWLNDIKTIPQKGQLTQLALVPLDKNIEVDSYSLKTSSVKVNNISTTIYDDFWRRVPTESHDYLASFYPTTIDSNIFDDGLYQSPLHEPYSRVVEVYHHSETCESRGESEWCGEGDYIKLEISAKDELDKLILRTDNGSLSRTATNSFSLISRTVSASGYMTIMYNDTDAPLDLTDAGGSIWLEEAYGNSPYQSTVVSYGEFSDNNKNWAYAINGIVGEWTTTPKPNEANLITPPVEEVTTCSVGKYLNPDTGRCRTLEEAVNALATCPEGQERNPLTNRCRAKVTAVAASLTPCGEGQERNPTTNRCRSIASAVAELMPCDEGYERNPATNRCRKVAGVSTTATAGTEQAVEAAKGSTWNVWTWALVGVVASGAVGYGIYEWRHELSRFGQSIAAKLGKK